MVTLLLARIRVVVEFDLVNNESVSNPHGDWQEENDGRANKRGVTNKGFSDTFNIRENRNSGLDGIMYTYKIIYYVKVVTKSECFSHYIFEGASSNFLL